MQKIEQTAASPEVIWPDPIEGIWNSLPVGYNNISGVKRPDITLSDRLFISAVLNLSREERPWGMITWLSDFYQTSRQTIYDIGDSILKTILDYKDTTNKVLEKPNVLPASSAEDHSVERNILKMAFPGSVSIRAMQELLDESLGVSRSIGFISQLLNQSGEKAGQILSELDYDHLDGIIALRDETFFQGWPILLLVEPRSGMIVFAHVAEDRQADTWATALLTTEDQNLKIKGFVEDMAKAFPASLKLIDSDAKSKKDNWHLLRNAGRVRERIENEFYRTLRRMEKIEKLKDEKCTDKVFNQYCELELKLEHLMNEHDAFEPLLSALAEALEIVDVKSGQICEFELHRWYLSEIIQSMEKLTHPKIKTQANTLRKAFDDDQLLTHLVWLAPLCAAWRERAARHWGTILAEQAEKVIARTWKLRQLVINGHNIWKDALAESEEMLQLLYQNEASKQLVQQLFADLDACPRASSLIENINGILKGFLVDRRSFRNRQTAQLYINLFTLWYNSHLFKRGKRKGKSPFEWANMNLPEGDWLTWLGFPKAS